MGDPESLGSLHLIVIESVDASCLYGAGETFVGTAAAINVKDLKVLTHQLCSWQLVCMCSNHQLLFLSSP
jgi:hypothetical protein